MKKNDYSTVESMATDIDTKHGRYTRVANGRKGEKSLGARRAGEN